MAKRTVLIVDDDKGIVNLISAFLREGGYEVPLRSMPCKDSAPPIASCLR